MILCVELPKEQHIDLSEIIHVVKTVVIMIVTAVHLNLRNRAESPFFFDVN